MERWVWAAWPWLVFGFFVILLLVGVWVRVGSGGTWSRDLRLLGL